MTFIFDEWPWKTIVHPFHANSSCVRHFTTISDFKLELQSGNANLVQNWRFSVLCDLENWWMTLKTNSAPLLCCFKLCASFHKHQLIYNRITVQQRPVSDQNRWPFVLCDFEIWWFRKTTGHLFYATPECFHHFVAICKFRLELPSGNAQIGAKSALTSVALTFDFWPWPFARTSLFSMVITPDNLMVIRWVEHSGKGVADRQTDGRTDGQTCT